MAGPWGLRAGEELSRNRIPSFLQEWLSLCLSLDPESLSVSEEARQGHPVGQSLSPWGT